MMQARGSSSNRKDTKTIEDSGLSNEKQKSKKEKKQQQMKNSRWRAMESKKRLARLMEEGKKRGQEVKNRT